jgi:hypothetical protein
MCCPTQKMLLNYNFIKRSHRKRIWVAEELFFLSSFWEVLTIKEYYQNGKLNKNIYSYFCFLKAKKFTYVVTKIPPVCNQFRNKFYFRYLKIWKFICKIYEINYFYLYDGLTSWSFFIVVLGGGTLWHLQKF